MRFEFATAGRILCGRGSLALAVPLILDLLGDAGRGDARAPVHGAAGLRPRGADAAANTGARSGAEGTIPAADAASPSLLIVTGRSPDRATRLVELLRPNAECALFSIDGEPTVRMIAEGVKRARAGGRGLVIGIGGGSAIDAAKAIAAMAANEGELLDYLEVIGKGRALSRPPLPCVAIPTTAGTGAEVTRNAVLGSPAHRVKVSLRHPLMLPKLAVVDPDLTDGLPPSLTAFTGLDALTQLIEPFVSVKATPLTDALCREGIERAARALPRVYRDGGDAAAREEMCLASLLGGLALANAGLGAVHGLAGPIGGMFPAPHGAVCAALLPHATAINIRALRERGENPEALRRYQLIARLLTDNPAAGPDNAVAWLERLCQELEVPPLRAYGLTPDDVPTLVEKAQAASSMKGNPIALTAEEVMEIMARAMG
ncbi:MAG: alcohol dehydrogenase [Phycisphaerae bacterium]